MTDGEMLTGEKIIIFSSDDWASGLKTSKYHIARQLARKNNVLFVNSIGLRAPTAGRRDLGRIVRKLGAFLRGARKVPEGLHVCTPIVIPFKRHTPLVKALNGMLLRGMLKWLTFRLGLRRPTSVCFIPTFNDVVGRLGEKAVVYYCIDDLRGYKGVSKAWFDGEEKTLIDRAACVISSAEELHRDFARRAPRAYYVPHGVDWRMFRNAVDEPLPEPPDLAGIPHPRLGFYGFLSDEWVDYDLLKDMAAKRPDWQIVLIGRPKADMDLDALIPEPNIHCLGLKPFEELPAYTRHFDVGLIPFNCNDLTRHCNPLKLLEYLSGGLPVVGTNIPELHKYADLIHIADSPAAFIAACGQALREGDAAARDRRSRAVQRHSWEARMGDISRIVRACSEPTDDRSGRPVFQSAGD